ncbi:MAG: efflux RND transporter periplasmic adaptor subunit [Bacteroidetes bacterium]|nr:efflux RND transporter periplasmic adaptor subunit [Bacteroidota bacterium]
MALYIVSHLLLAGCRSKENESEIRETFPVTHVIKSDTSTFTDYVAEVHAIQNVEMRARVTGYLEKIHVDEGTYVIENQLLFTINNREYLEELAKAKALYKSAVADMDAAELELKNVQHLAEKKIVSSTELALAKNKLEAQKAKMEEASAHQSYAQIRLSNTEIRAPFNGIINRIPHKTGSLIDEGTLLTTISHNDDVYAYFDVSEKEYLGYARNLQSDSVESKVVSLILADGSEHPYKGKIETIESIINEKTGTIAFRARFSNPGKIIKHGASGRVRLRKKFNDALLIPQKSTFEIQDKHYVYILDNTNKVNIRNITIKHRLPHLYIINQGLKEGDKIIYEGIQNVKTDMIIQPSEISMTQIIKELASK